MKWVQGFLEVSSRQTDLPRFHGEGIHSSNGPRHRRSHIFHVLPGVNPSARDSCYFRDSSHARDSSSDRSWSAVSPERCSPCHSSSFFPWIREIHSAILYDPSSSIPWSVSEFHAPLIGSKTYVLSGHLAFVPSSRLPSSRLFLPARTLSAVERRSLLLWHFDSRYTTGSESSPSCPPLH